MFCRDNKYCVTFGGNPANCFSGAANVLVSEGAESWSTVGKEEVRGQQETEITYVSQQDFENAIKLHNGEPLSQVSNEIRTIHFENMFIVI